MIIGTGIDIVDIKRMEAVIERTPRMLERILTIDERRQLPEQLRRRIEYICGRFAAKEAISKSLGVGIGQHFSWHDLSILNRPNGKPEIIYHHARFFDALWKTRRIHVSIAHEVQNVIAFAIIEES